MIQNFECKCYQLDLVNVFVFVIAHKKSFSLSILRVHEGLSFFHILPKVTVIKMEINLEKYFGENVSFFISLVGLYAFVCWSYDNFKSLFQIIFSTVNPNKNETLIKRYGKWAGKYLITAFQKLLTL